MTKEFKIALGLIALVGGAGYIGYTQKKINELSEMIDVTVDNISDKVEIDIGSYMLDAAIQKAVDREVRYVSKVLNTELNGEIRSQVKKSVDLSATDIKFSVKTEIERQVKNVDISDMEREIIAKAKDAVADKFERKLDNLLEEYNENLQNVKKIYGSIAKTIAKD